MIRPTLDLAVAFGEGLDRLDRHVDELEERLAEYEAALLSLHDHLIRDHDSRGSATPLVVAFGPMGEVLVVGRFVVG